MKKKYVTNIFFKLAPPPPPKMGSEIPLSVPTDQSQIRQVSGSPEFKD